MIQRRSSHTHTKAKEEVCVLCTCASVGWQSPEGERSLADMNPEQRKACFSV